MARQTSLHCGRCDHLGHPGEFCNYEHTHEGNTFVRPCDYTPLPDFSEGES